MLGPAGDLRLDAGAAELAARSVAIDVLDVALAVEPALVEQLRDRLVRRGLERAQAQVLELPLELPHAEAVGERREEVEHLARRLRRARLRRRCISVAQRLRALGELDQHDADVLDHREQHLAQVLGLRRALLLAPRCRRRARIDAHPRDAGDQRRDVGAEARRDLFGVERAGDRQAEQQRGARSSPASSLSAGEDRRGADARGRAPPRRPASRASPARARA